MRGSTKHAAVVGAGPGGLTCAMLLAKRGFKVSVFEAQDAVGGRNAPLRLGPYTFDTGPTFLMLKDILDEVFEEAGRPAHTVLDFRRLDPMYELNFGDRALSVSSDPARMKAEIARVFPGRENSYDGFLRREKARFRRLYPCLQKSYDRLRTLLHPDLFRALPHLALNDTLYSVMRRRFGDEQLALSFTFQSKYLGMSPWDCPGLFAMIPYIEHAMGVYHVMGGLSVISQAMADTVRANGGEIHRNTPVRRVRVENRAACGVELEDGQIVEADAVVINADFGYAAAHLFEPGLLRKYTPRKLDAMKYSCSTFMIYAGLDRQYDMPFHTICFADDYRTNVEAVFRGDPLGDNLSFYVRNASVLDPSLAPEGHAAIYILVPVANNTTGATDWEKEAPAFRDRVLRAVARRTPLKDVAAHVVREKVVTPLDWEREYRVHRGATFNLAHNLGQMLHRRPHNRFEEFDDCYLVGGGTHPGSGLPTIYESGRIAANLMSRKFKVPFVSRNLCV
jgi:phytoene desaturase